MKYGIQCHAGGWFLCCWKAESLVLALTPYSGGSDENVRLVIFDTKEEAMKSLPKVVEMIGVSGEYTVIPLVNVRHWPRIN